jgi:hypothetical protein
MNFFNLIKSAPAKPVVGPVPLPPVMHQPEVGIHPLPPVQLVGVHPPEIHFGLPPFTH